MTTASAPGSFSASVTEKPLEMPKMTSDDIHRLVIDRGLSYHEVAKMYATSVGRIESLMVRRVMEVHDPIWERSYRQGVRSKL